VGGTGKGGSKTQPTLNRESVTYTGETAITLPDHTRAILVRALSATDLRVAWATGQVNSASGDWFLLREGETYWEDDMWTGKTLYMRADVAAANVDVAVLTWE